jgi:NADPH:quinone reductase-like Zn-dependent oxidoreductase
MTPKFMRGVELRGHGGLDQLHYRNDLALPRPAAGEVLIQIGAAAVNNTDVNLRIGWYSKVAGLQDGGWTGAAVSFPLIQGADACGRIVAVGPGVQATRIGERVLVNPMLGGAMGYFGSDRDGAFAQFSSVPAPNAHKVTSPLSDAELVSFPCSYSTAENLLTRGGVQAGETVLVTGGSGGVGSAAVQLAKRRGAIVIAIARQDKGAAVRQLGANRVLAREADLPAELGRESVDVVIDVVGGPQFPSLLEVLCRSGRYVVAGAIAGPRVDLDLRTLYLKDLKLIGCTNLEPQVFANLVGYIERGEVKPVVSAIYPLTEITAAQTVFLSKAHVGKIVLVP